jgi:hypothetical protein
MKLVSSPINFGRMSHRKDPFSPKSQGPFAYDVNFEALDKHILSPKFASTLGRFEQGVCHSRLGIEEKSWKSIETNCYSSLEGYKSKARLPPISIEDMQDLPLIDSFFA